MYTKRYLLILQILSINVATAFFGPMMGDDDTDNKIHRKGASKDDENFFDLEQKNIQGRTVDLDRFSGLHTIVAFNMFKKDQSCEDVEKIFKDFLQLYYIDPVSIAFAIVPDSVDDYNKCSYVITNTFAKKKVNHVVMKPVTIGKKHALFDYFSNLYDPKEIEDGMYFLVKTEGDVELHYECETPLKMKEPLKFVIDKMHNPPHYSEM